MKCPQCGFVASDSKDACPKCRLDLIPHKLRLGIITAAPAKAKEASPQAAEAGTPSTANQVPGLVQPPAATRESTSGAATADEIARKGSWLLRVFSKPPKVELEAPAFDLHLAAAENTPAPSVEKALQGAAPAPETAQSKPAASAAAPDAGQSKPKPDTVPAPEEDFSDLILALESLAQSAPAAVSEALPKTENDELDDLLKAIEEAPPEREDDPSFDELFLEDAEPAETPEDEPLPGFDNDLPELSLSSSAGTGAASLQDLKQTLPKVSPEVLEFGEDDDFLDQKLDEMIGGLILDIAPVKEPVKEPAPKDSGLIVDDVEISFEFDIEESNKSPDELPLNSTATTKSTIQAAAVELATNVPHLTARSALDPADAGPDTPTADFRQLNAEETRLLQGIMSSMRKLEPAAREPASVMPSAQPSAPSAELAAGFMHWLSRLSPADEECYRAALLLSRAYGVELRALCSEAPLTVLPLEADSVCGKPHSQGQPAAHAVDYQQLPEQPLPGIEGEAFDMLPELPWTSPLGGESGRCPAIAEEQPLQDPVSAAIKPETDEKALSPSSLRDNKPPSVSDTSQDQAPGGEALDYLEALLSTIKVEEIVPASDLAPPEASAGDSTKEEQPPPAEESDEIELKDLLAVLAHEEHLDELLTSCEKKRPAFHTRAAPAGTHTTQATAALTASTSRGHAENTARQMPEVDAALWQEAESAFQASTDQSSLELEIGLNEICEMPQNQTLSLLFEVLDEELSGLRDGARQLAAPLRSEDRRVDNRALAAAVHNYQAEEKLRTAQSHDKSTFDDDGLPAYLTAAPLWRRASGAAFDALFAALAGVVFAWLAVLPEEFKQALVNAELPLLIEALPHGLDVMLIVYCSWLLLPMLSIGFTGRTFGGRIVSTAIVNIQGGPPSFAQAVVRSCAQGATLLSLGLGLLPLLGRNRQTLHDILAATCVVYQSEE